MNDDLLSKYADALWRGDIVPRDCAELERTRALVSRIWDDIWNLGKLEACREVFHQNYVGHLPLMTVHGPDEFANLVRMYRQGFPDVHLTVDDYIASGDRVVVRWTSRGTHEGELMGMAASHKPMVMMGISIFRMQDGLVAEEWEGFDTLGMMKQVGAIP
ncbi:MAG: ester cyclase [Chloroflexi bacterium]|uniref:ester cyclase n=1 Tax=Candidatus Flexifilum breve TaxID=3140694 RepID=UPI0031375AD9|nr:ester cyclase [Chloroflexota bacterium]